MSGLQDRINEIANGLIAWEPCPRCGAQQNWTAAWTRCTSPGCGFLLDIEEGPPDILCSSCGDVLRQTISSDIKFQCQGCGRTVLPLSKVTGRSLDRAGCYPKKLETP